MGSNPNSDFNVNTYVSGNQEQPDIAIDPLGNFVITWQSNGQDGDGYGIFARAYDSNANPLSSEFQVNTLTTGDQIDPAIGMDNNGNFIITWTNDGAGYSGQDIYGQRFNSSGQVLGPQFQANLSTEGDQTNSDVAMDGVGNFVVVYESDFQNSSTNGQDTDGTGIFGQRFDTTGALVGQEFRINTTTQNDQSAPVVAMNSQGEFVAIWVSQLQDGSGPGIFGQRYSSAGSPVGLEFQVNTTTEGEQINPAVAIDENGNFVVTWQSDSQDGKDKDGYGVYARRYNATGSPTTSEILVNDTTQGDQIDPSVAIDAAGNFTIVWASENGDGDGYGIFGQSFLEDGSQDGGEFRVNQNSEDDQTFPAIGLTPSSEYVITWQSENSSGDLNIRATNTTFKEVIRGTKNADDLIGTSSDERILGLRGDDTLQGSGGNDALEGGNGNDSLQGDNGNDVLSGGLNQDILDGGNGNDTLTGDAGQDTFVLRSKQGSTIITDFEDGVDFLGLTSGLSPAKLRFQDDGGNTIIRWQGVEIATLLGINAEDVSYPDDFKPISRPGETINGTSGNDKLNGTGGDDSINGKAGNDQINGRAGDDTLTGAKGNDRLSGDKGNDTLNGNQDNDILNGGDGDDFLDAGNGNDQVTGGAGADTFFLAVKSGRTTITDFQDDIDVFSLDEGITARSLTITQVGSDTTISWKGQELALVKNTDASAITTNASDFI